jgi:lipopolysaccharide transport system permease protein
MALCQPEAMAGVDRGFDLQGEATPVAELVRDVWRSRALIQMLAKKEFFVKYRRATFGMLWAAGLPLFQATVLAVVFSRVVKVEVEGPYAVFVFPAYAAWSFFSSTLPGASTSIVDNAALSNKIYFPRAVLPISSVVAALYSFAFTLVALLGVCLAFGETPGLKALLLVPAAALLVLLTAGLALLISGMHVYFRDMRFFLQAALSVWLFVTPVLYPLEQAGGVLAVAAWVNPMTGVCELFRTAVTDADAGWSGTVAVSVVWVIATLLASVLVHRRYNRVFSDLL